MKENNPFKDIFSIILMFGPIILFWYVDWYWIFGYYNLYFTYTSYGLFKENDNNPEYRNKYPLFVFIILPLLFGFIGLIITFVNGIEEIREGDEDFKPNNKNKLSQKKEVKFCSDCGEPLKIKSTFCGKCGNKNKYKKNSNDLKAEKVDISFNTIGKLNQIELNWILGIKPIYELSVNEMFKHPGYTVCYHKTKSDEFYEGEHLSFVVRSIEESQNYIDYLVNRNGGDECFSKVDSERKKHLLTYLFDVSIVESDGFQYVIIEINRLKKKEYISIQGDEILYGIHEKTSEIKSKIRGFEKLIFNVGEKVADGRYTSNKEGVKIDSWHSDFETAHRDVKKVLSSNDPENEFLNLNNEEAKNKIKNNGYSFESEKFDLNFYRGNSSWWVNFNLN